MEIIVDNVNQALPTAVRLLAQKGIRRDSRNGPVTMFPTPVTTIYHRPTQRVLFDPTRDCNPFFHFAEALWMLAGRADVEFVAHLVKRMADFSDDGEELHGAYGRRWRSWFRTPDRDGPAEIDQLAVVIKRLRANPDDRRCVIQMWDATWDLDKPGKDVPCNTQCYVWIGNDERLDMSVLCRSNDLVMGAYGANAVHFSYLQEYLAASVGREVGTMYQFSNNLHMYEADRVKVAGTELSGWGHPYTHRQVVPYPLMAGCTPAEWDADLAAFFVFVNGDVVDFQTNFFKKVARPMWLAHELYKTTAGSERYTGALEILETCQATDWRLAAEEWLNRRYAAFRKARDDGPTS